MTIKTTKDQNSMLCGGKHYVFVPHEKPRCPLCAFHTAGEFVGCMLLTGVGRVSYCSRNSGRTDRAVGYWTEVS